MSAALWAMVHLALPPPSLAIVCVGEDAASTGDLQDALHNWLDGSAIVATMPARTVAERLHTAPPRKRVVQNIRRLQLSAFDQGVLVGLRYH